MLGRYVQCTRNAVNVQSLPFVLLAWFKFLVYGSMFEERRPYANEQHMLASKQLTHVVNLFGLSVSEVVVGVGCDSDLLMRHLVHIQLVGVIQSSDRSSYACP